MLSFGLKKEALALQHEYIKGLAAALFIVAQPVTSVYAETLPELDAMAEVAVDEEQGIAYAQQQSERGEYLEAIATLERVLALHPKSDSARLLHAVNLCKIDDQLGGAVELGKLKQKNFAPELWASVMKLCPLADKE
jgi:tetratricopeptide (TPR) repeat protein